MFDILYHIYCRIAYVAREQYDAKADIIEKTPF